MPRKRIPTPEEQDPDVPIVLRAVGRPRDNDDPREPMPQGAITALSSKRAVPIKEKDSADLYSVYARNLVATDGDVAKALAATLGVGEEFATTNMVELHDKIRAGSRSGRSVQDLLEAHDMTREVRMVHLRDMMYTGAPAVKLKAIELVEQADMTAKAARMGGGWEAIMRAAKEKAERKSG